MMRVAQFEWSVSTLSRHSPRLLHIVCLPPSPSWSFREKYFQSNSSLKFNFELLRYNKGKNTLFPSSYISFFCQLVNNQVKLQISNISEINQFYSKLGCNFIRSGVVWILSLRLMFFCYSVSFYSRPRGAVLRMLITDLPFLVRTYIFNVLIIYVRPGRIMSSADIETWDP